MQSTHRYEIWPDKLTPDQLWEGICAFAADRQIKANDLGYFLIKVDPFEESYTGSIQEILKIIKKTPRFESISTKQSFGKEGTLRHLDVDVDISAGTVSIAAESSNVDLVTAVHAHVASNFGLRKRQFPIPSRSRATYPQPKIFLGRHFDGRSANSAAALRGFLALLGFDVLEGERYNSQPIPEKVRARIDEQSLYLALVTTAKSHDWITAEAAYALGKDKHVILLVEDSTSFNPTILGKDLEQIRFPADVVEKCFSKLLEEFRDIGVRF